MLHSRGITPAYAGKSRFRHGCIYSTRDHPRLRGEKMRKHQCPTCDRGSPPLTRGKGKSSVPKPMPRRITPAYAGKRLDRLFDERLVEDHPRLRGEKSSGRICKTPTAGSPPLTRGKAFRRLLKYRADGITPAYAGKSCSRFLQKLAVGDHPRLRGEKTKYSCKTQSYHIFLSDFSLHFIRYSTASFQLFI